MKRKKYNLPGKRSFSQYALKTSLTISLLPFLFSTVCLNWSSFDFRFQLFFITNPSCKKIHSFIYTD